MTKRILVTGAGGPAAINFIKSLRMVKEDSFYIVGTDVNKFHIEVSPVDARYIVPKATAEDYVDKLNEIIEKEEIEMVHPQPDIEVLVIAENRNRINAITRLPKTETIRICQDKQKTAEILKRAGVPVPESIRIKSRDHVEDAFSQLVELCEQEVVWVRAIKGAGSKAALPVKEVEHAIAWMDYWIKMKGLDWSDFMLCEFLPGKEYAWQSIWDNGELITSQARQRLEYLFGHITPSGQTSTPAVAVTVHNDLVNEVATKAVLAIDKEATGIFCVDIKENRDGVPCVTEINAGRFFTTSNFFSEAGVNMPYYHVKLAFGEEIPPLPKYNPIPAGYYWVRVVDGGHKLIREGEFTSKTV